MNPKGNWRSQTQSAPFEAESKGMLREVIKGGRDRPFPISSGSSPPPWSVFLDRNSQKLSQPALLAWVCGKSHPGTPGFPKVGNHQLENRQGIQRSSIPTPFPLVGRSCCSSVHDRETFRLHMERGDFHERGDFSTTV